MFNYTFYKRNILSKLYLSHICVSILFMWTFNLFIIIKMVAVIDERLEKCNSMIVTRVRFELELYLFIYMYIYILCGFK